MMKKWMLLAGIMLCMVNGFAGDRSDDTGYVVREESLDDLVNEAAGETGTVDRDRKPEAFDELAGKKRVLTDEEIRKETGMEDKTILNEAERAQKNNAVSGEQEREGQAGTKNDTGNQTDKDKKAFIGEVETITGEVYDTVSLDEEVFYLKKMRLANRINVAKMRVSQNARADIDALELFTFSTPVKVHRLYLITEDDVFYKKKDIIVGKHSPYLLNLKGKRIKQVFCVYEPLKNVQVKSHLFILGVKRR